jgi:hypothetical protein
MADETQAIQGVRESVQKLIDRRVELFRFLSRELSWLRHAVREKSQELGEKLELGPGELADLGRWMDELAERIEELQKPLAEVTE